MTDFKTALLFAHLACAYGLFLHFGKEWINNTLDLYAPRWYTSCVFCRGVQFGVIAGVLISITFYYLQK